MTAIITLIENGVRHGRHARVIRFSAEPDGGGLKIIYEYDEIGIPDGVKEKIFGRKYLPNTALGLLLAQEILTTTGLRIRESWTYKKGARFEILIPPGAFSSYGNPV